MDLETHYRRLLERFGNGDIDRRTFLGNLGRMAIAAGVFGNGMRPLIGLAQTTRPIRFESYGGIYQAALDKLVFQPFTVKTGIKVDLGAFASPEELLARVEADGLGIYNVFSAGEEGTLLRFLDAGFVSSLDESKIPRLAGIIPRAVERLRKLAKGKLPGVPMSVSGAWVGYNRQKVDRAEIEAKGYDILLDPRFKGSLSGEDHWVRRIYYAALQTRQDPNNIKTMDVIWEKIRESKRLVQKYWTSGAEQTHLFSNGGITLSDAWFVRVYNLRKQGLPIEGWPQKGTYVTFSSLAVLKGTPLEPVYEMFDILLRPEVQFPLSLETATAPLLDPSKHPAPKEVQALGGYDPTGTLDGYNTVEPAYWAKNADQWQRQYQRIMTAPV